MKTAILSGATGLIGKQLMYKLLESEIYQKIIILVRNELPIKHPKLFQLLVDFDKLDQFKDQISGQDFFCCLGTTMKKAGNKESFYKVDFTYCYELGKIAAQLNAQSFNIVSAIGADPDSSIFYSSVKGKLEEAITNLNIIHLNIFHPSILLGDRTEFRFGERIGIAISQIISPLLFAGLRKYRPIHAAQVANSMLKAANIRSQSKIKRYSYDEMMQLQ